MEIFYQRGLCAKTSLRSTDLGFALTGENKLPTGSVNGDVAAGRTEQNVGLLGSFLTPRCGFSDSGPVHVSVHDYCQLPPHHPAHGTASGVLLRKLFLLSFSFSSHAEPQAIPAAGIWDTHFFIRLKAGLIWCQLPNQQRFQVFFHQRLIIVKGHKGILRNTQRKGVRKGM